MDEQCALRKLFSFSYHLANFVQDETAFVKMLTACYLQLVAMWDAV